MSSYIRLGRQAGPWAEGCSCYLFLFNKPPNLRGMNNDHFSVLLDSGDHKSRHSRTAVARLHSTMSRVSLGETLEWPRGDPIAGG